MTRWKRCGSEADLFALATHWEGYGMAIAEALKRGVPVAVTDGGAAGNLVTPEAGVVLSGRRPHQSVEGTAAADLRYSAASRHGGGRVAGRADAAELADAGDGNSRRRWLGERTVRRRLAGAARTIRSCRSERCVGTAIGGSVAGAAALMDLGAGTGSMFRFLAPIIGRGQDWILVDADAALLDDAFGRTAAWARRHGFAATVGRANELLVSTPRGLWRMQAVRRDLSHAVRPRASARCRRCTDAVAVCSALLDLVSRRLARRLFDAARCPVPRVPHGRWSRCMAAAPSIRRTGARGLPSRPAARQGFRPGTRHGRAIVRTAHAGRARLRDRIGTERLARSAHRTAHAARVDRWHADAARNARPAQQPHTAWQEARLRQAMRAGLP